MKNIQAINIWNAGENLEAVSLRLYISYDDLESSANFIYQLCTVEGVCVAEGGLPILGTDYNNWGSSGDSNSEAYNYAAAQLNLILV
jgi:hypothetical protein